MIPNCQTETSPKLSIIRVGKVWVITHCPESRKKQFPLVHQNRAACTLLAGLGESEGGVQAELEGTCQTYPQLKGSPLMTGRRGFCGRASDLDGMGRHVKIMPLAVYRAAAMALLAPDV